MKKSVSIQPEVTAQAAVPSGAPPAPAPFYKKIISSGIIRFAGWWSIFAGVLALNSVCPICGSTACPVGIGATGIVAGIIAAIKQWGARIIKAIIRIIRQSKIDNCTISSGSSSLSHEHSHTIQH